MPLLVPLLVPLLDPEPRLPGAVVVELPVDDEPLPSDPVPEAPLAPLEAEPCSLRHCSFCSPVSESQLLAPTLAPLDDEPPTPVDGEVPTPVEDEPVPVLLEPTEGVAAAPPPMLLEPVLPLVPDELCAKAPDTANNAAAVAETMSFSFMCAPLGG